VQNRYVGDIGDYLKLGILRALSPGYHLGVAWWLFPDEGHNGDGRHISYLSRPANGGTSTPTCSTRCVGSSHLAGGMFGNWRWQPSFPAPRSPASPSHAADRSLSDNRHGGIGWRPCG
jgi:hypothetical protein